MHISLASEKIFSLFGLPVTNSLLMTWITMLLLIVVGSVATGKASFIPGKLQNFLESIIEFFFNLADSIIQDRNLTRKVFPVVCTLFLLIVLSNWLGLIPGVGSIGFRDVVNGQSVLQPIFRPTNADINSTLSWAIISVVFTQFIGIVTIGAAGHFNKYVNLRALKKGSFEGVINFSVGFLEIFSELSRIISFSFRLFGNVFAGEVLLTVIAFLVPYVAPLPFYFLELFVGLIQGLVFVMLTLVFIKIASISHDSHGHDHENEHNKEPHMKDEAAQA